MAVARLIRTLAGAVAAVIVIGIVLKLVGANPHNVVVSDIHDAGAWLVSPFSNVFTVKNADWHIVLNWGLAALVYLLVGGLIASLLARSGSSWRYRRTDPVA
jgi:uncharacterized membrane protein YfcA